MSKLKNIGEPVSGRNYYPRTQGLPWAKKRMELLEPKQDLSSKELNKLEFAALMKRTCENGSKGPRHLFVTLCG